METQKVLSYSYSLVKNVRISPIRFHDRKRHIALSGSALQINIQTCSFSGFSLFWLVANNIKIKKSHKNVKEDWDYSQASSEWMVRNTDSHTMLPNLTVKNYLCYLGFMAKMGDPREKLVIR